MSEYKKPYLSPPQQIELLLSRGMEITDLEKAEECLARIGYYRLSAYWFPFRKENNGVIQDDFKEGTSFSSCMDFYVFDKKLRILTMDALERIEISIRTDIALQIGRYDQHAHRKPEFLHKKFTSEQHRTDKETSHEKWLKKQDRAFRFSKEEFTKHFKTKYPNQSLPIWIDVELWDFGSTSKFFAGMNGKDQNEIASLYNLDYGKVLENWLRCLNNIRNVCAHHHRLWNKPIISRLNLKGASKVSELAHLRKIGANIDRFYTVAAIIKVMLNRINPASSWAYRLQQHMNTLPKNTFLRESNAGFPADWRKLPLWKKDA